MAREFRVISALAPSPIPVPRPFALCEDIAVTGAPFYVMEFVDGIIAHDDVAGAALAPETRGQIGAVLIDTLVELHSVDAELIGLADLSRRGNYVARQLDRWKANYHAAVQARNGIPLQDVDDLYVRLREQAARADSGSTSLVHGDFRIENCVLSPEGAEVRAVLDWELCTIGAPLADFAQLLAYWQEPGETSPLGRTATVLPGFPRRADLVEHYAKHSGRSLDQLDYFLSFAYWRLACIAEGVYSRYSVRTTEEESGHMIDSDAVSEYLYKAQEAFGRLD
jgi:aminoglycoside phosphotransferase (APT) family kinase protein